MRHEALFDHGEQYRDIGQCDSHPEALVAAAQEKCSLRPDSAAESSR
jgi:hypothetical protein